MVEPISGCEPETIEPESQEPISGCEPEPINGCEPESPETIGGCEPEITRADWWLRTRVTRASL